MIDHRIVSGHRALIERYFPCPFERGHSLLVILGVLSSLVYIFSRIGLHDQVRELPLQIRDLPLNLMWLTFLISAWGQRQRLKFDRVIHLLILAILIPWILFGINAMIDYETALKYRSANDLLKLFLFLPLAWWIGGSAEGARRMLIVAFLGLLTAVALDPELSQSIDLMLRGRRVDFEIHNAQHGAMFFGLVLIYCVCSVNNRGRDKPLLCWRMTPLYLAALFALAGLAGTQTRAAFLGLLACGLVAIIRKISTMKHLQQSTASGLRTIIALVLVAVVLTSASIEILYPRVASDQTSVGLLLSGNIKEIPFSSSGIRIHSWAESLKWIAERPLTGWGSEAHRDVIRLAEHFPEDIRARFGHLHNGYLYIALSFGAAGLIFLAFSAVTVYNRIKGAASPDLFYFASYGGLFFLALNLFESFFKYSSGHYALAIILAGGYSQYLSKQLVAE